MAGTVAGAINWELGIWNWELVLQPCLDTIPLTRSLLGNRLSSFASGSRVAPRIGTYRGTDAPQHVNNSGTKNSILLTCGGLSF